MSNAMPDVPQGSGKHPITMVVISANQLAESSAFYTKLFGWQMHPMAADLMVVMASTGPTVALRSNIPEGFPGIVPYIGVSDVEAALERVVTKGGTIERAAWSIPMVGKLARFKDSTGTIYGMTNGMPPGEMPLMPAPFGANPKPPPGTICAIEMYAKDGAAAARFFTELFGWGTLETMPNYMAFNPGAGVTGVFQSHTPTLPAVSYIYDSNVSSKIKAIESAGGQSIGEPMSVPGMGTFGYFKDPSGTTIGLIGP